MEKVLAHIFVWLLMFSALVWVWLCIYEEYRKIKEIKK